MPCHIYTCSFSSAVDRTSHAPLLSDTGGRSSPFQYRCNRTRTTTERSWSPLFLLSLHAIPHHSQLPTPQLTIKHLGWRWAVAWLPPCHACLSLTVGPLTSAAKFHPVFSLHPLLPRYVHSECSSRHTANYGFSNHCIQHCPRRPPAISISNQSMSGTPSALSPTNDRRPALRRILDLSPK
jgi:hypothetical protein